MDGWSFHNQEPPNVDCDTTQKYGLLPVVPPLLNKKKKISEYPGGVHSKHS